MLNVFVLTIIVACIIYIIVSISEVNNFHMVNTQEKHTNQIDLRTVRDVLKEKSTAAVRLYIKDDMGELTFLWQGLSSQLIGEYSSTVYPYIDYGAYQVIQELPESTDTNVQLVVAIK